MTALALPVRQQTPEWHEARRHGIGSSDAPVIAGERGSVVELWGEKTGLVPRPEPDEDTARLFEWGHRLEPVVADWYAERTGRKLRRAPRLLVHPDVPWAVASLDRVVVGERRIVEIKTDRWGWRGDDPVPGAVLAQVQHQMWVTGYPVADVAVLTGGSEPRVIEVERDQSYIDDLVFLETQFQRWVETRQMPPMDGSENARRVLSRLYPADDGTMLPASPALIDLADQLRAARAAKKSADADEATLGNAIRAIVGEASGVEGVLTLRKSADSTRVNWPAVAAAYRALISDLLTDASMGTDQWPATALAALETADALRSIHTEDRVGPRVLRLSKEES